MSAERDWKRIAEVVWSLLDDLDTVGDVVKIDYAAHRRVVQRIRARRRRYMYSPDG